MQKIVILSPRERGHISEEFVDGPESIPAFDAS